MSIYRRDEICPEWEPVPYPMSQSAADLQERGFYQRALKSINWTPIPFKNFPDEGIFGQTMAWLMEIDASHYASCDGEDLLLIDNTWFGWPDPPRWGLISKPTGQAKCKGFHWGHFADLPSQWVVQNLSD